MKFSLTVLMDNAAFADDPDAEIARILKETSVHVLAGTQNGNCRDANGNTVGVFKISGR